VSKDFESSLSQNGISWKRFVPYTPPQNGVAKRKN
jgi:hypothetical protein